MSHIDDRKIPLPGGSQTVRELVLAVRSTLPSDAALDEAERALEDPSPAMITGFAAWIELVGTLRCHLKDAEILEVMALSVQGHYDGMESAAPISLIHRVAVEAGSDACAWAEMVLDSNTQPEPCPEPYRALFITAAVVLDRPGDSGLQYASNLSAADAVHTALSRASEQERARWAAKSLDLTKYANLEEGEGPRYLSMRLRRFLPWTYLLDNPTCRQTVLPAVDFIRQDPRFRTLAADFDLVFSGQPYVPVCPTEAARAARGLVQAQVQVRRDGARLPAVAYACRSRSVCMGAPLPQELVALEAWLAASPARRAEVEDLVAAALGDEYRRQPGEGPFARFDHMTGVRFLLIPGGNCTIGLSDAEVAALRSMAPQGALPPEWELLFTELNSMRPAHKVTIAPLLVSEYTLGRKTLATVLEPTKKKRPVPSKPEPGEMYDLATIVRLLEKSGFRLLSEAEWEYCIREGRSGELTPHDVTPDQTLLSRRKKSPNGFGLGRLGILPEVVADGFVGSYEGAPKDGAPRQSDGPCVVRGGAGWIFPWQGNGEWQLLLSAQRGSTVMWDDMASVRVALGVEP